MENLENLHRKGIIKFTGSTDVHGLPVLAVGGAGVADLEESGVDDAARLMLQYLRVLELTSHEESHSGPVALLLDLSHARKAAIAATLDLLHAIERRGKGALGIVYVLRPRGALKAHRLRQQLPPRASRDGGRHCPFRVVFLKNHKELHAHVDPNGLTSEFGGVAPYNHGAVTALLSRLLGCVAKVGELLARLPGLRDRVELLQEYETAGLTSHQLKDLQTQLAQQFQADVSASGLEETITLVKQTLHVLESPENGVTSSMTSGVAMTLTEGGCRGLRTTLQRLQEARQELQESWTAAQERLSAATSLLRCQDRALEVQQAIKTRFLPLLNEHPVVGRSLSQAELYRTHFTSTLYEPAKELLGRATEILEEIQRLRQEHEDLVGGQADMALALSQAVQPFAQRLQHLQACYIAVHVFYTLYDKCQAWYRKVLRLMPETLLRKLEEGVGQGGGGKDEGSGEEEVLLAPPEWRQSVRAFLMKHPPPRPQHLEQLDRDVPSPVSRLHRHQAHVLALRVRFLLKFLDSRRLPARLVRTVFRWKEAALGAPPSPPVRPHSTRGRGSIRPPPLPRRASSSSEDRDDTLPRSEPDRDRKLVKRRPERLQPPPRRAGRSTDDREDERRDDSRKGGRDEEDEEDEEERFIRLTYTPRSPNARDQQRFTFEVQSDPPPALADPESESGIEVTEAGDDPWDLLVDKIREVSSSGLSSDLKLKYVTDLLSCSLHASHAPSSKPRPPRHQAPPTSLPRRYQQRQSPAAHVARMRRRLARSTADLHAARDSGQGGWGTDSGDDLTLYDQTLSRLVTSRQPQPPYTSEEGLHPLRHSRSLHSLGAGLDVERAWPEPEGADNWEWLVTSGGLSRSVSNLDLHEDLQRLRQCRQDRLLEEEELERERERCSWLQRDVEGVAKEEGVARSMGVARLEGVARSEGVAKSEGVVDAELEGLELESLQQDTVEAVLRRAEHILKMEEERRSQPSVTSSPTRSEGDVIGSHPSLHRDSLARIFDQSEFPLAAQSTSPRDGGAAPTFGEKATKPREISPEQKMSKLADYYQEMPWFPTSLEVNGKVEERRQSLDATPAVPPLKKPPRARVGNGSPMPNLDDTPRGDGVLHRSSNGLEARVRVGGDGQTAGSRSDDLTGKSYPSIVIGRSEFPSAQEGQASVSGREKLARAEDVDLYRSSTPLTPRDPPPYSTFSQPSVSLMVDRPETPSSLADIFASPHYSTAAVAPTPPRRSSTVRVRHTDIPARAEEDEVTAADPEPRVRYTDIPEQRDLQDRRASETSLRPLPGTQPSSASSSSVNSRFEDFRRCSELPSRGIGFGRVDSTDHGYDSNASLRSSALGQKPRPDRGVSLSQDPQLW